MKNKIIKFLSCVAILTFAFAINVTAAPKTMPDGQKFDPEFYAAAYPDVVAVLGNDENVLYSHYLSNGKAEGRLPYAADTGNSIAAKFDQLKAKYPEGTYWTNESRSYTFTMRENMGKYGGGRCIMTGMGCAAFAFEVSNYIFGEDALYTQHYDYDNVKPGDILRVNGNTHSVVVMSVDADGQGYTICEGNYNSSVHWGRHVSKSSCIDGYSYIYTRY